MSPYNNATIVTYSVPDPGSGSKPALDASTIAVTVVDPEPDSEIEPESGTVANTVALTTSDPISDSEPEPVADTVAKPVTNTEPGSPSPTP